MDLQIISLEYNRAYRYFLGNIITYDGFSSLIISFDLSLLMSLSIPFSLAYHPVIWSSQCHQYDSMGSHAVLCKCNGMAKTIPSDSRKPFPGMVWTKHSNIPYCKWNLNPDTVSTDSGTSRLHVSHKIRPATNILSYNQSVVKTKFPDI